MIQQIDQLYQLVGTLESRYGNEDLDFRCLREMLGELAANNERLHLVNVVSNDGYFDWDLKSGLAVLSPRYYEIIGYREGEITPDMEFLKRLIHPDDMGPSMVILNRYFLEGSGPVEWEYRIVCYSGVVKWMRVKGKVVERDGDGSPLRMVGTVSDCWRRLNLDHLCRSNFDQGLLLAA